MMSALMGQVDAWYAFSSVSTSSSVKEALRDGRGTTIGFTAARTRIEKSKPLQYGPGTSTPSPASQMLYRRASIHAAAPGAVAKCDVSTGM